jgi:hypothetical protein
MFETTKKKSSLGFIVIALYALGASPHFKGDIIEYRYWMF